MGKKKAVVKKKAKAKKPTKAEEKAQAKRDWLIAFQKEQAKNGVQITFGMKPRGRRYFRFKPFNKFTGGLVKGSWVVFWGPENSGKTTAALDAVSVSLSIGETVAIIDVEGTLIANPMWLASKGINIKDPNLIIIHGKTMEEMFDAALKLIEFKMIDLLVVDSISAMSPKGEMETSKGVKRSMSNDTVGLRARQANKFGRLAIAKGFALNDITIILIGQVYKDINSYGGGDVLSTGSNIKHLSFLRLHFRRAAKAAWPKRRIDGEDETYGFMAQIRIDKVKQDGSMPENSILQVPFIFNHGYHYAAFLFNEAKARGFVKNASKNWIIGDKDLEIGTIEFKLGRPQMEAWLYDTEEAEQFLEQLIEQDNIRSEPNMEDDNGTARSQATTATDTLS